MNLETQIVESMKIAMKEKDANKLGALRGIKAALMTLNTSKEYTGKEITDEVRMKELQRMVKQRNESAIIFKEANRTELYDKEMFEISVIEAFLPKQLSTEEIEVEVKSAIAEVGATDIKQMGKVIGLVSKKLIGKADGKTISEITKNLLS